MVVSKTTATAKHASPLRERTSQLLRREIAFIANLRFKELDADQQQSRILADVQKLSESITPPPQRGQMPAHLERMCATPLLTPAEERQLFCRMNYLKYRANALRSTLSERKPKQDC